METLFLFFYIFEQKEEKKNKFIKLVISVAMITRAIYRARWLLSCCGQEQAKGYHYQLSICAAL